MEHWHGSSTKKTWFMCFLPAKIIFSNMHRTKRTQTYCKELDFSPSERHKGFRSSCRSCGGFLREPCHQKSDWQCLMRSFCLDAQYLHTKIFKLKCTKKNSKSNISICNPLHEFLVAKKKCRYMLKQTGWWFQPI